MFFKQCHPSPSPGHLAPKCIKVVLLDFNLRFSGKNQVNWRWIGLFYSLPLFSFVSLTLHARTHTHMRTHTFSLCVLCTHLNMVKLISLWNRRLYGLKYFFLSPPSISSILRSFPRVFIISETIAPWDTARHAGRKKEQVFFSFLPSSLSSFCLWHYTRMTEVSRQASSQQLSVSSG